MHASVPGRDGTKRTPRTFDSTIGFLRRHAPFSAMDSAQLDFLAKRLRPSYYPRGSQVRIFDEHAGEVLLIVRQGLVVANPVSPLPGASPRRLVPGDSFFLEPRSAHPTRGSAFRAEADTICLELEHEGLKKLLGTSPVFRAFHAHTGRIRIG